MTPGLDARPRLRWFLLVAMAAHAGVFEWAIHSRPTAGSPQGLRMTELDVEVEAPPDGTAGEVAESTFAPVHHDDVARAEARPSAVGTAGPEGSSSNAARQAPAPSAEPAGDGSWAFLPTAPASGVTRLASAALDDAVRASVHATVAEGRTRDDPMKAVLGGFTQHDLDLGLVPGSEFVGLTRDAVRTSRAPDVGHAMLELQVDGAGLVSSVRVLDASSDRSGWDEAAAQIAKAARSRVARVPSGARGYALRLEVTSTIKTVSGRTPTGSALAKAWRGASDPIDAVLDGNVPAARVVAARIVEVHVL